MRQVPFTPDSGSIAHPLRQAHRRHLGHAERDALVLIRDGKHQEHQGRSANRGDATSTHVPVLDLSDYTCLPGLIDMHTHLTDRPEDTADLTVYFSRPAEETLRLSKENASATLLAGFTSVRNVGTYALGTDTALRDAINAGKATGPRMQVSGPYLTIPQGGGDLYIPDFKEPPGSERFHAGVARGAEQFRERAEFLIDNGSDVLKVIASGAVLAFGGVPGAPEMTQDEILAVVDIAHAVGKKVAAHAHGAESIRMAIAAGADTIEHASYLDDAGIAAALKRGNVALAMDVYNGDYIDTEGRRLDWPEEFLRKNTETTEIQRLAFTKAVEGRRAHRVRHRLRRVPAWTQCAPVSDHGGARHDAHAGDSVRHARGRAIHGLECARRDDRAGQVRRHHRGERRSAAGHLGAAERRGGRERRNALQERYQSLKYFSYSFGIAGIERISMSR